MPDETPPICVQEDEFDRDPDRYIRMSSVEQRIIVFDGDIATILMGGAYDDSE